MTDDTAYNRYMTDVQKVPDDLRELAIEFVRLRSIKEAADAELALINKAFDWLRITRIPELMTATGTKNATFDDVGRVTLTADLYAGIQPDMKDAAYEWLSDTGRQDLVQEYVQPSTLKAALRRMIEKGEEIPEELFRVTPFLRASVTKV